MTTSKFCGYIGGVAFLFSGAAGCGARGRLASGAGGAQTSDQTDNGGTPAGGTNSTSLGTTGSDAAAGSSPRDEPAGGTNSTSLGTTREASDAMAGSSPRDEPTAGSAGIESRQCVGAVCSAGQACVAYRTVGGVFRAPDGGVCAAGRHLEGQGCQPDFAYTCAALVNCEKLSSACSCAPKTACAQTTDCAVLAPATWLDPAAQIECQLVLP